MALTQISTGGIKDDAVTDAKLPANSVGNSEMKDDAVGIAELSATGTASSSTFLRGDNSWVTPTDTNTQVGGATGVDFNDDVKSRWGTGNDLSIFHNGTDSKVESGTGAFKVHSNDLHLMSYSDGDDYITCDHEGSVVLFWHNGEKLRTVSNGVRLNDNVDLCLGTDEDCKIRNSGTYTRMDDSSGNMYLQSNVLHLRSYNDNDHYVRCTHNAAVELFYDNAVKCTTTGSGITVTGSVNETSDAALKNNLQVLTNSLSNLKQIQGYSYEFKDTEIKSIGVTTQDVEKVYPDLVQGVEGEKTLNYTGLIGPLIEAVKELSTEVETLKTKVAALENR